MYAQYSALIKNSNQLFCKKTKCATLVRVGWSVFIHISGTYSLLCTRLWGCCGQQDWADAGQLTGRPTDAHLALFSPSVSS